MTSNHRGFLKLLLVGLLPALSLRLGSDIVEAIVDRRRLAEMTHWVLMRQLPIS